MYKQTDRAGSGILGIRDARELPRLYWNKFPKAPSEACDSEAAMRSRSRSRPVRLSHLSSVESPKLATSQNIRRTNSYYATRMPIMVDAKYRNIHGDQSPRATKRGWRPRAEPSGVLALKIESMDDLGVRTPPSLLRRLEDRKGGVSLGLLVPRERQTTRSDRSPRDSVDDSVELDSVSFRENPPQYDKVTCSTTSVESIPKRQVGSSPNGSEEEGEISSDLYALGDVSTSMRSSLSFTLRDSSDESYGKEEGGDEADDVIVNEVMNTPEDVMNTPERDLTMCESRVRRNSTDSGLSAIWGDVHEGPAVRCAQVSHLGATYEGGRYIPQEVRQAIMDLTDGVGIRGSQFGYDSERIRGFRSQVRILSRSNSDRILEEIQRQESIMPAPALNVTIRRHPSLSRTNPLAERGIPGYLLSSMKAAVTPPRPRIPSVQSPTVRSGDWIRHDSTPINGRSTPTNSPSLQQASSVLSERRGKSVSIMDSLLMLIYEPGDPPCVSKRGDFMAMVNFSNTRRVPNRKKARVPPMPSNEVDNFEPPPASRRESRFTRWIQGLR